MDEAVLNPSKKGLLKAIGGSSIAELMMSTFHQLCAKKSGGATSLYHSRDIATAIFNVHGLTTCENIYAVGQEQSNHFRQLKAV